MTATLRFFGYLALCLALAALAVEPLTQAVPPLAGMEPERILGKLAQLLVLLGAFWFLRWQGLHERAALGFGVTRRVFWRTLGQGWLLGLGILGVLFGALMLLGTRHPDPELGAWSLQLWLTRAMLQPLAAGLLVAFIEEIFFRGALFTAIERESGPLRAILYSSLLYALLHFMRPQALPIAMAENHLVAWHLFLGSFRNLIETIELGSLLALFLAGALLGWLRVRHRHIGMAIGMHAGWVLVIQSGRRLTDGDPTSPFNFCVGHYDGVIGWLAALWLLLILLELWKRFGWPMSHEH